MKKKGENIERRDCQSPEKDIKRKKPREIDPFWLFGFSGNEIRIEIVLQCSRNSGILNKSSPSLRYIFLINKKFELRRGKTLALSLSFLQMIQNDRPISPNFISATTLSPSPITGFLA